MSSLDESAVRSALEGVQDPVFEKSLAELGTLLDLKVEGDSVRCKVALGSPSETLRDKVRERIDAALAELAPHIPKGVIAAVERAMAKRPEDRFEDMTSFLAALTGRAPALPQAAMAGPSTHAAQALSTGPSGAPSVDPPRDSPRRGSALGFAQSASNGLSPGSAILC